MSFAIPKEEAQRKYESVSDQDHTKTKIEVGQIWSNRYAENYHVVEIRNGSWYDQDGDGWSMNSDGCPAGWARNGLINDVPGGWCMIGWADGRKPASEPAPIQPPPQDFKSLTDFFAKVPEGYCACNMLRSQCDFHR